MDKKSKAEMGICREREREAQRDVLLKETSTEKTINKECFHINLFIDLLKRKGKNKL